MNTRILLKDSYDFEGYPFEIYSKLSLPPKLRNKISEISEMNKIRSTEMHKKATESSYMKRSQTPKQRIFAEVFGNDAYLKPRKRK